MDFTGVPPSFGVIVEGGESDSGEKGLKPHEAIVSRRRGSERDTMGSQLSIVNTRSTRVNMRKRESPAFLVILFRCGGNIW